MKPTFEEFALAVKAMRSCQKWYFKAERNTPEKESALKASKGAEALVDKMLEALNSPQEALL